MTNLHAIASGVISVIHPGTAVTIHVSTGYQTQSDGRRVPTYEKVPNIVGEIQPLSSSDLQHMDGMNISGETRKVYLSGRYYGNNRIEVKGGDLIELPSNTEWPYGSLWQVVRVLEQYPSWCALGVVRQMPDTAPG